MPITANNTPEAREAATALATEILGLLSTFSERFDSGEAQQWRWLEEHSPDPSLVEILRDSTLMALRVVNAIGALGPVNGATISERYRVPKGTVSKVTRRLLAQNLIISETLPHNKKEILFRLTPLGRDLNELHRTFDEQMERGFRRFLARYQADELALLIRVLHDANEASFIDLGLPQPPNDQTPQ